MRGYYIDGKNISQSDRLFIDKQIESLGYIYNAVKGLVDFTFYAEDNEPVSESLKLPAGVRLTNLPMVP